MRIDKDTFNHSLRTHSIHEQIFREDSQGNCMYVILNGKVDIRKRLSKDTTQTMITLKPGDFFGEMAIIDRKPRSAAAIAATDCRLLLIDEQTFYTLIKKNPDFSLKMIKTLSSRLRSTDALLVEMMNSNTQKRILKGIEKYLAERSNSRNKKSMIFSKSQFCIWTANHLGINEKTTNMVITNLLETHLLRFVDASSDDLIRVSEAVLKRIISI